MQRHLRFAVPVPELGALAGEVCFLEPNPAQQEGHTELFHQQGTVHQSQRGRHGQPLAGIELGTALQCRQAEQVDEFLLLAWEKQEVKKHCQAPGTQDKVPLILV